MRHLRPLPAALALLLVMSATKAQTVKITADSVSEVVADFIGQLVRVGNVAGTSGERRRLLDTTSVGTVQQFFAGMFGSEWKKLLPSAWTQDGFSWVDLAEFEYDNSLQDFLSTTDLAQLSRPQSLTQLVDTVKKAQEAFCKPDEFDAPQVVYSHCSGPSVALQLLPKHCELDSVAKVVTCTPASLQVVKRPGGCVHKHWTTAEWRGKQCAITGHIGLNSTKTIAGKPYTVPISKELWMT